MRFKLTLENNLQHGKNILPLNYQYELSSWIYKTLNYGNKEFADWLHERGYSSDYKNFKLFTFSNLLVPNFRIKEDRMKIESRETTLFVSFYPIDSLEYFISGLFKNQKFSIGDKKSQAEFIINGVEQESEPLFTDEMEFKTLSPVLISYKEKEKQKYAQYKSPKEENYGELLVNNLLEKYNAFYINNKKVMKDTENERIEAASTNPHNFHEADYHFELLTKPKSRLITVKSGTKQESKLRGFMYRYKIKAPSELIRLGYYAGFGEKNSLGFGCAEIIKTGAG